MLTAHTVKILQSLDKKKFRQKYNLFAVEGNKIISELQGTAYKVKEVFSTRPEEITINGARITPITDAELRKISFLQHPKDSLALCEIRENTLQNAAINLVLDGIQDPGNLGTLIRLADWFGIRQIVCSPDTADFYNPKTIQASMGSFLRVNIIYEDLATFLAKTHNQNIGTDMDGMSIYEFDFPLNFNLIMGNEGNGIRPETELLLQEKITIPRFGEHQATESLNVAMAAGIILGQAFSKK